MPVDHTVVSWNGSFYAGTVQFQNRDIRLQLCCGKDFAPKAQLVETAYYVLNMLESHVPAIYRAIDNLLIQQNLLSPEKLSENQNSLVLTAISVDEWCPDDDGIPAMTLYWDSIEPNKSVLPEDMLIEVSGKSDFSEYTVDLVSTE